MASTEPTNTKAPVDYGPFPWWSQQILRTEYVENERTKAALAREWETSWGTIDAAVKKFGLESEAA